MKKMLKLLLAIVAVLALGLYIIFSRNERSQKEVKVTTDRILNETRDAARNKAIEFLGMSLQAYYQKTGAAPKSALEFVKLGIVSSVPNDPKTNEPVFYKLLGDQPEACVVYFYLSSGEKTQAYCSPQVN